MTTDAASAAPPLRRLIVAVTGASGAAYGVAALRQLRALPGVESHLVVTPSGVRTLAEETDLSLADLKDLADVVHPVRDIGAPIASGSFRAHGMLVAPCSIKTLSGIAHCHADDLVVRAADVCLKERRRLVLLVRETPLHAGHLALMELATRAGAIVMPPVPAFYTRPQTIDDLVHHTVGRALELCGLEVPDLKRWQGSARGAVAGDGEA